MFTRTPPTSFIINEASKHICQMATVFFLVLFVWKTLLLQSSLVSGHAYTEFPPARGGVWIGNCGTYVNNDGTLAMGYRQPNMSGLGYASYYDGTWTLANPKGPPCGVCRDAVYTGANPPFDHEHRGLYGNTGPIIVYGQGLTFDVRVIFPNPHGGNMRFNLCPVSATQPETQSCYENNLLEVVSASSLNSSLVNALPNSVGILTGQGPSYYPSMFYADVTLRLPTNLLCNNCVLQMNYFAAEGGALFRSCSEFQVIPKPLLQNYAYISKCLSADADTGVLALKDCNVGDDGQIFPASAPWEALTSNWIYSGSSCLGVQYGSKTAGASIIVITPCNAAYKNQQWTKLAVPNDPAKFQLQVTSTAMCLTAPTVTSIVQQPCTGADNQLWTLSK